MPANKSKRSPQEMMSTMIEAVDEFDGFIMGIGGSNNYFTFNASDEEKEKFRINNLDIYNREPQEEKVKDLNKLREHTAIRRSFFASLLDTTVGAYYTHDILQGSHVLSSKGLENYDLDSQKIEDYLKILADTNVSVAEKSVPATVVLKESSNKVPDPTKEKNKYGSMSKMIQEGTSTYKIKDAVYVGSEGIVENMSAEEEIQTLQAIAETQGGSKEAYLSDLDLETRNFFLEEFAFIPDNESEYVNESGMISEPSLYDRKMSAYIIKDNEFIHGNKRKEFLSLFFNGISPIELSRCTPYIEISFYHQNFNTNKDSYLDPAGYMNFYADIDPATGKIVPSGFTTKTLPVDEEYKKTNNTKTDISYMDMFTSPQTMVNANINSEPGGINPKKIKSNPFNTALEPFAPQASLSNLTLTTTSGGYGFTSEKKGSMSIIIHDRSRLKQFASIIAVNQLAKTRAKITFGWSHPDGDIQSGNIIGRFLDSMKNSQHYTLTSSNMRFQGNAVEVDISMFSMGDYHVQDMPAAAGLNVPLRVIGPAINTIIESLVEKAKLASGIIDSEKTGRIHPQLELLMSSANSTEAMVSAKQFGELNRLIKSDNQDTKIITKIAKILGISDLSGNDIKIEDLIVAIDSESVEEKTSTPGNSEIAKIVSDNIKKQTGLILRRKYEQLFYYDKSNQTMWQPDYFTGECCVNKTTPAAIADADLKFFKNKETVSLGKCIANFVAAPMISTGEYSEVQIFFYPINQAAGYARRFTTASFPIQRSELGKIFDVEKDERDNKNPEEKDESIQLGTITSIGMFNKIASLLQSFDISAYGLTEISSSSQKSTVSDILKNKNHPKKSAILATYYANYKNIKDPKKVKAEFNKEKKEKKEEIYKAAVSNYVKTLTEQKKESILSKIYSNDIDVAPQDKNTFRFPALNMTFEVLTPIKPPASTDNNGFWKFFYAKDGYYKNEETSSYGEGRILRIHVTDDANVGSSTVDLASQILFNGAKDPDKNSAIASVIAEGVNNLSDQELKEYIKRHYATIIYGSGNSTVKGVNVSSTTSDRVAQGKMMTFEKNRRSKNISKNINIMSDAIRIVPASVDIQMLGCPFLERGNHIFLDMGTNTDLDNCYTVNSVTHTISKSEFSTSLGLVISNQGTLINTRGNLLQKIKKAVK